MLIVNWLGNKHKLFVLSNIKKSTLLYKTLYYPAINKARQAAITTEILEIVGGAEALKN